MGAIRDRIRPENLVGSEAEDREISSEKPVWLHRLPSEVKCGSISYRIGGPAGNRISCRRLEVDAGRSERTVIQGRGRDGNRRNGRRPSAALRSAAEHVDRGAIG